jgi:hypothetical protein
MWPELCDNVAIFQPKAEEEEGGKERKNRYCLSKQQCSASYILKEEKLETNTVIFVEMFDFLLIAIRETEKERSIEIGRDQKLQMPYNLFLPFRDSARFVFLLLLLFVYDVW